MLTSIPLACPSEQLEEAAGFLLTFLAVERAIAVDNYAEAKRLTDSIDPVDLSSCVAILKGFAIVNRRAA